MRRASWEIPPLLSEVRDVTMNAHGGWLRITYSVRRQVMCYFHDFNAVPCTEYEVQWLRISGYVGVLIT